MRSPDCWLAGERVASVLGEVPVWEPVLLQAFDPPARETVEERARAQGLPGMRWPEGWPTDVDPAMRAAVFAKQAGRVVAFSLAAFRQQFLAGRDLSVVDNVLIAAAACELHPRALLKGVETRSVREGLTAATRGAAEAGVRELPALRRGDFVVAGPDAPERFAGG